MSADRGASPAPAGEWVFHYDEGRDILWAGNGYAGGGTMIEVHRDVYITFDCDGSKEAALSSIALIHASRHRLWKALCEALVRSYLGQTARISIGRAVPPVTPS